MPRRWPPIHSLLWPCLILMAASVAAHAAVRHKLPTADEPKFLQVGAYLAEHGDWEPASTTVHAPLSFYTHGRLLRPFTFASESNRLRAARLTMLVYAWGLGLAVYVWTRVAYGPKAGLLAVALWAALPETLAHVPLITTDVILACWVTWTGFALWRWCATGRWRWAAAGGGALGLALLSKYTAALWVPVVAVLGAALAVWRPPPPGRRRALAGVAVILVLAYALLCVGYGGRGLLDTWSEHPWASARLARWAARPGVADLPLLAPLPWWQGIDYQSTVAELGHPGFLLGRRFLHAPWYYLPVAFLYKMPTPLLALLAVAPLATRRVRAPDRRHALCLLGPPLALAAYLMFANRVAAGFRYAYPLLPALCVWLGRFGSPACILLPQARNAVRACLALCFVLPLWHFPNYLAAVNLFAFGGDRAYRVFADSTLDWGQEPPPAPGIEDRIWPIVGPGPVPVPAPVLVNVNTYHDLFTRGAPHAWLHGLPVTRVHNGVWLEVDGTGALAAAPPLLAAMARGQEARVRELLEGDPVPRLDRRITAYRWLALAQVERGELVEARRSLSLARGLDVAQAHGLDPAVAFGACLDLGRQRPDDPVARNNAGVAAYLEGAFSEAAADCTAAFTLQPAMPAPFANLAVIEAARGRWEAARDRQRTFELVVRRSEAKPFHPYRVYYGHQRIMLGDVLELWPRYTLDQLEAEIAWHAEPTAGAGAARARAYQAADRWVEAGIALHEAEAVAPGDPALAPAWQTWRDGVRTLRARGAVGV